MKLFIKASFALLAIALFVAFPVYAAQPPVDLGTAKPFAILAGTGITDTPTSVITGNVGLSPAAGSNITGLTCAEVTGTIYDVNGTFPGSCEVTDPGLLTTAKNDLTTAFVNAAGRTPDTTVPTELGGTTLTAGTYASASTPFGSTAGAGPLVLDGQNNYDSVFIFKMGAAGTGLTVGPGSTVSLINGAQACNIFWELDTASIDTTAVFKGTIMALNSITVNNGANIEGRLLARNANVTLVADTITAPTTCASGLTPGFPNTGADAASWKTTTWSLADFRL